MLVNCRCKTTQGASTDIPKFLRPGSHNNGCWHGQACPICQGYSGTQIGWHQWCQKYFFFFFFQNQFLKTQFQLELILYWGDHIGISLPGPKISYQSCSLRNNFLLWEALEQVHLQDLWVCGLGTNFTCLSVSSVKLGHPHVNFQDFLKVFANTGWFYCSFWKF